MTIDTLNMLEKLSTLQMLIKHFLKDAGACGLECGALVAPPYIPPYKMLSVSYLAFSCHSGQHMYPIDPGLWDLPDQVSALETLSK